MKDLNEMTVAELMETKTLVAVLLKGKKVEVAEANKAAASARDIEMRTAVKEGDKVSFLFNKVATEGKVLRVSEKSVTVEFVKDGETVKRYRKFSEILEVLTAEVA